MKKTARFIYFLTIACAWLYFIVGIIINPCVEIYHERGVIGVFWWLGVLLGSFVVIVLFGFLLIWLSEVSES